MAGALLCDTACQTEERPLRQVGGPLFALEDVRLLPETDIDRVL